MKIVFTFFLLAAGALAAMAQTRVISGRLLESGSSQPMPGVNITIKGTTIGTTTDIDGNYSIEVPVGSTLVFSFIGMITREVVVTPDNSKAAKTAGTNRPATRSKLKPIPGSLFADSITAPTPGVAVLDDHTPTYRGETPNPTRIKNIRRLGNRYIILANSDIPQRTGFGLQLASTIVTEHITQLPGLQSQFTQGQPVAGGQAWRGADSQEIFSWGPLVRTLEYDGTSYPYDRHGRLVPLGTGNGLPAQIYNATALFRTGWTSANELTLALPARGNGVLSFDIENRNRNGVIPNTTYNKLNISTGVKNFQLSRRLMADAKVSYNRSSGSLISHGANMSTIMGSIYRTPATFDNANGFSRQSIQPGAYQLADGSLRSHAPQYADNPYGLVNRLPDHDVLNRLISMASLHYRSSGNFNLDVSGDMDYQQGRNIFGLPPGYAGYQSGRLTDRREKQTVVSAAITPAYLYNDDYGQLKIGLTYQVNYTDRMLTRTDGFQFINDDYGPNSQPSFRSTTGNKRSRISQEASLNLSQFFNEWLFLRLGTSSYFSNTLASTRYTNIFPTAGFKAALGELLYLDPINTLNIYASISRSIREAPLLYTNWSYGSTQMEVASYASFFEASELYFNTALAPETERKFQMGVETRVFNDRLKVEISYSNNLTDNFVAPLWNGFRYELANVAVTRNYGTDISADYTNSFSGGSWSLGLRWSKYNNVVDELYSPTSWVPLAGFSTIQSVLAAGNPVGAIYGTAYLRDDNDRVIIGNDGFPIKDTRLRMLGSPIPDWTLGLSAHVQLGKFRVSMVIDSRRGGEMWNGTLAALDYLGRSSSTAALRNTANYVFEGVNTQGTPNTQAVNFADPTKPVSQNRWTRYEWDGVSEAYIEDMSWVRLSETTLSYTIRRYNHRSIKEIKFQLSGRNLLLLSGYNGADPSSTLFGYATGTGLDLFNTPSIRSYSAQLTIKI